MLGRLQTGVSKVPQVVRMRGSANMEVTDWESAVLSSTEAQDNMERAQCHGKVTVLPLSPTWIVFHWLKGQASC